MNIRAENIRRLLSASTPVFLVSMSINVASLGISLPPGGFLHIAHLQPSTDLTLSSESKRTCWIMLGGKRRFPSVLSCFFPFFGTAAPLSLFPSSIEKHGGSCAC